MRSEEAACNTGFSPIMKMLNIILSMRVEREVDNDIMEELHKPENALMHQKSLNLIVTNVIICS